jgi:hypothetical protein
MLEYGDYVTIKIIKVKDDLGRFTHWESKTSFSENWYESEVTGPDFYGVVDEAFDYIKNVAQYWTSDNSNERK